MASFLTIYLLSDAQKSQSHRFLVSFVEEIIKVISLGWLFNGAHDL